MCNVFFSACSECVKHVHIPTPRHTKMNSAKLINLLTTRKWQSEREPWESEIPIKPTQNSQKGQTWKTWCMPTQRGSKSATTVGDIGTIWKLWGNKHGATSENIHWDLVKIWLQLCSRHLVQFSSNCNVCSVSSHCPNGMWLAWQNIENDYWIVSLRSFHMQNWLLNCVSVTGCSCTHLLLHYICFYAAAIPSFQSFKTVTFELLKLLPNNEEAFSNEEASRWAREGPNQGLQRYDKGYDGETGWDAHYAKGYGGENEWAV